MDTSSLSTVIRSIDNIRKDLEKIKSKMYYPRVDPGSVIGMYQILPELRGFWPISSNDSVGALYDLSGQGRTLTKAGTPTHSTINGIPYAITGNGNYYYRTSESSQALNNGFTIGGWFLFNAYAATQTVMSKWNATGSQRGYLLEVLSTGAPQVAVSGDGTNVISTTFSGDTNTGVWKFLVGRYTPSTELALFQNSTKGINTTSIPASGFGGTSTFNLGSRYNGGNYTDGSIALPFMLATPIDDSTISYIFDRTRVFFGV